MLSDLSFQVGQVNPVCARWPISDEAASDENDIFCANYLYVFAFIIVLNCSVLFCCVLLTATLSLLLDFLKIARLVYFLFFFCFFFLPYCNL